MNVPFWTLIDTHVVFRVSCKLVPRIFINFKWLWRLEAWYGHYSFDLCFIRWRCCVPMSWSGGWAGSSRWTPVSPAEEEGGWWTSFKSARRELPSPFTLSGDILFSRRLSVTVGSDDDLLKLQFGNSVLIFSQQTWTVFKWWRCKTDSRGPKPVLPMRIPWMQYH